MTRAYHRQTDLVGLLASSGPMTVRQLAEHAYGRDTRALCRRMSGRIRRADLDGLVEIDSLADRPGQQRGLWPAKWRAKVAAS